MSMVCAHLFGLVHVAFMCCQHVLKGIEIYVWVPLPQLIQLVLHGGVLSHQPPSFIHLTQKGAHSLTDVRLHTA